MSWFYVHDLPQIFVFLLGDFVTGVIIILYKGVLLNEHEVTLEVQRPLVNMDVFIGHNIVAKNPYKTKIEQPS